MNYRKLGNTGEQTSVLGFGCMRFPVLNKNSAQIDEQRAINMLRFGIDNGISYVDTAYPYHDGNSEIVVGKALQDGYRQKVLLATKCPCWEVKCHDDFDRLLNEQLTKLNTDHIDVYLLHALNRERYDEMKSHDFMSFFARAKADGRVKHVGFSFHDGYDSFQYIIDDYDGWEVCQIQYNYLDVEMQAGTKGLRYAAEKGLGVIVMEPLRGGSLALDIPNEVQQLWNSNDEKRTPAQWALNFVWNAPQVSVVLSGMSTLTQVKQNLTSANKYGKANSLTEQQNALYDKVRQAYEARIKVRCTGCGYCMPCPNNVNIPLNFRLFNVTSLHEKAAFVKRVYQRNVKPEQQAKNCLECGLCEGKCPQKIAIRDKLAEAARFFSK